MTPQAGTGQDEPATWLGACSARRRATETELNHDNDRLLNHGVEEMVQLVSPIFGTIGNPGHLALAAAEQIGKVQGIGLPLTLPFLAEALPEVAG